jgi:hypothetical protein
VKWRMWRDRGHDSRHNIEMANKHKKRTGINDERLRVQFQSTVSIYCTIPQSLTCRSYNDQIGITSILRELSRLLPPPRLDPLPNSLSHTDGNVFLASAQSGPELVGKFVKGHTHLTAVFEVGLVFLVVQLGCGVGMSNR